MTRLIFYVKVALHEGSLKIQHIFSDANTSRLLFNGFLKGVKVITKTLVAIIFIAGMSACGKKDNVQVEIKKLDRQIAILENMATQKVAQTAQKNETSLTLPAVLPTAPPVKKVNILLIDDRGRAVECFKGVYVSDVDKKDGHTHFMTDGKINYWPQKVLFSYVYTDKIAPTVGTILYRAENGIMAKISNVQSYDVYVDNDDGTLRYDDHCGRFPRAPKGAGYIAQ